MKDDKISVFARDVYRRLGEIPRGRVATYGGLAQALGCGSPRAVGQALRVNPDSPRVPCHRVVRADGSLGGYEGESSGSAPARKRRLLEEEGVEFLADGRVDLGRCRHEFGK